MSATAAPHRPAVTVVKKMVSKTGVLPGSPGSNRITCHVCGEKGHCAGFIGALYVDCINFACYLCKKVGHTTSTCPFRIKPNFVTAAGSDSHTTLGSLSSARWGRQFTLPWAREREMGSSAPSAACWRGAGRLDRSPYAGSGTSAWWMYAAVTQLHTRRISVLSFHPSRSDLLVSGDKSGELGMWNIDSREDRTVFSAHRWLINALAWTAARRDTVYSCSADGSVKSVDVSRLVAHKLVDLNPGGWTGDESNWRMFYALSCDYGGVGPLLAGDDSGRMWALDPRSPNPVIGSLQAHGVRQKVQSLHHNPLSPHAVLSAGNDWTVRVWDVRTLSFSRNPTLFTEYAAVEPPSLTSGTAPPSMISTALEFSPSRVTHNTPLPSVVSLPVSHSGGGKNAPTAILPHPRVPNSAYWSPVTGAKILTTCIDNRLRIWDYVNSILCEPSREIVHSHDFGRYLTPFRAVWDPKDTWERMVICGRYISEPFSFNGKEEALHPVDIIDVSAAGSTSANPSGVVAQLVDPLLTTICPVDVPHPSRDIIASGSSTSIYLWRPRTRRPRLFHGELDCGVVESNKATNPLDPISSNTVDSAAANVDEDIDGVVAAAPHPSSVAASRKAPSSRGRGGRAAAKGKGSSSAAVGWETDPFAPQLYRGAITTVVGVPAFGEGDDPFSEETKSCKKTKKPTTEGPADDDNSSSKKKRKGGK